MKLINKNIIYGLVVGGLFFASCEEKTSRTVYSDSTPVIESATINPSAFIYGDSVTFTAKVSDSNTPLSTINMKMIVDDVLIANETFRTAGNHTEVSSKVKIQYAPFLNDEANVEVLLTLTNVEGNETKGTITNVKGKRIYYENLYLVLDDGKVYDLVSTSTKSDNYASPVLKIKSNSIRYKIAQKITADNQIDFSGDVWGYKNGAISIVDETGDYITTKSSDIDYITQIVFDNFSFLTNLIGDKLNANDLTLDSFEDVTIKDETFKKLTRGFEKNQEITLFEDLTSTDVIFNTDYFERISADKVKFIGESSSYTLYYSQSRKFVAIDPSVREYPNILLVAGEGLGYPSKIMPQAHTSWNFTAPLDAIVFRRVATDTYQGTVYFDVEKANFKPFENKDWGNEKKSTDFTMPALIAKDSDLGKTDGNWYANPEAVSGNYIITINLASKIVTAEALILP